MFLLYQETPLKNPCQRDRISYGRKNPSRNLTKCLRTILKLIMITQVSVNFTSMQDKDTNETLAIC